VTRDLVPKVPDPIMVTMKLEFPYTRTLGPVLGAFAAGLRERRLLASRTIDGKVQLPPLEYDPATGNSVETDLVEVGPGGTIISWTWISSPTGRHPFDRAFAFALIKVDGADTALVHVLTAETPDEISTGRRVRPRWKFDRIGRITDIEGWEIGK
jgi:uncharacterized OB-fold protein